MLLWLLYSLIFFLTPFIIYVQEGYCFFELILYPAALLKVFMSCKSFLVEFLGSLIYTIISSANSESLTSFLICIPLISFCCFIDLARTSRTIMNRYGESGQPCLVPDFSGIPVSFSPFSLMLAIGLLYTAFIMFRNVPCIP